MILMQKETEKLARDAFTRIHQNMATGQQENDIILNWCFASVQGMMKVMSLNQATQFAKSTKQYVQVLKGSSSGMGEQSVQDFEMI